MRVNSFLYDESYIPSAPIVRLTLRANKAVEVTALVDSGSDATLIPINILKAIGARHTKTKRLRGVTGVAKLVGLYTVNLHINTDLVHSVHVVAGDKGTEIILGRDVLNHHVVTLDGPAGVTEIRL